MNSKLYWLILVFVLIIGIYIGLFTKMNFLESEKDPELEKFSEVLNYAYDYYYKEVDKDSLIESAINGMLNELDPHSIYIPKEDQIGISEQFRGNFDGIGIEFQIINDSIVVVSSLSGGPSEAVGILPGDRILEINSENAIGFRNQDVINQLRGEKGTTVELKIYRPSVQNNLDFTIIRDQIPLSTIDVGLMVNDSIGYIVLSKFVETSFDEMENVLSQLNDFGMKKLILDLRNNPGGYLDQAVKIADLFIADKKVIVSTKGRKNDSDYEYYAEKTYSYEQMPLIILVNTGTASASEILSGAIQDWDRGLIVGETTFGKGLVQQPFILADNSAVRITVSKYYTPSGREIQRDYENSADYFGIVYARNEEEGENFKHNLETDTNSVVYHTSKGRVIRGNGGITPDYIIKNDDLTYYSILLRSKDLFYKFARNYMDKNGNKITSIYGESLSNFINDFKFTDTELKSFIRFAAQEKVTFVKEEWDKDKEYITMRLKAQIAKNYWNNAGWYTVLLNSDKQFLKAKELLESNQNLME